VRTGVSPGSLASAEAKLCALSGVVQAVQAGQAILRLVRGIGWLLWSRWPVAPLDRGVGGRWGRMEEPGLGIVGREGELARVESFVGSVSEGPSALLLEGAAGIGKTTLWQAGVSVARARGHWVLACRACLARQDHELVLQP
jgi:hypothetical protein